MRKFLTRTIGVAAVAVGFALGAAGTASAEDIGPYPSVAEQQAIFIDGGANAGKGAAQLVSSSVLGVPAAFMDYGEEIILFGSSQMPGSFGG